MTSSMLLTGWLVGALTASVAGMSLQKPAQAYGDKVDCKVSKWSDWSICSVSCGSGGIQQRHRRVMIPSAHGGAACPPLDETRSCDAGLCDVPSTTPSYPETTTTLGYETTTEFSDATEATTLPSVDCKVSKFGKWSLCSAMPCGEGVQQRQRHILVLPSNGGASCPPLSESRPCKKICKTTTTTIAYPETTTVRVETEPTTYATTTVDYPTTTLKAETETTVYPTTAAFSEPTETTTAYQPVDCKVSKWSKWSLCSANPCSDGFQERHRKIITQPSHGGAVCPPIFDSRPCHKICDVPSTTIGYPETTVFSEPTTTDYATTLKAETEATTTFYLKPVDCVVSKWSQWSHCSGAPCGSGFEQRLRSVLIQPINGGHSCPSLEESRPCNLICEQPETTTDYATTVFSEQPTTTEYATTPTIFSLPTETTYKPKAAYHRLRRAVANYQQQQQQADETEPTTYATTAFSDEPTTTTYAATTTILPVDCKVTKFSKWSLCSAIPCGEGIQERHRTIRERPSNGGAVCPPLTESRPCQKICDLPSTTIDYETTVFSEPTTTDYQTTAQIETETPFTTDYATTLKAEPETTTPKPVDCKVSKWSKWSRCSVKPCGQGIQRQSRKIVVLPAFGGVECPILEHTRPCHIVCPTTSAYETTTLKAETETTSAYPTTTSDYETSTKFREPTAPKVFYRKRRDAYAGSTTRLQDETTTDYATPSMNDEVEQQTTTFYFTTQKPEYDCSNKADGAYPTSECAAKYFVCDNGATSVLLCPNELRFDVELKLCNRPEEMPKCGGIKPRIVKPLNDFRELQKVQFDCTGKADGYYPEAKCSNTYFSCTGGLARELHCQPGLVYSQSENACEGKHIAFECTGVRPTPTTTTMRSPISTTAPLYKCFGKADGNYAAGNCESFYFVCTGGRATQQICPPGLLRFDAELNQCNAKAHIPSCGGQRPTTVEQVEPEATTLAPFDCQRRPDGNFANPLAACSELYYACSYGKAFAKSCPGGLFFNIAGGHCDFKSKIAACKGSLLDDILTTPMPARKHHPTRPQTTTYQPEGEQQQQGSE